MRGRGHLMVAQGGDDDDGQWLLGGDGVGQTKQGGIGEEEKGEERGRQGRWREEEGR